MDEDIKRGKDMKYEKVLILHYKYCLKEICSKYCICKWLVCNMNQMLISSTCSSLASIASGASLFPGWSKWYSPPAVMSSIWSYYCFIGVIIYTDSNLLLIMIRIDSLKINWKEILWNQFIIYIWIYYIANLILTYPYIPLYIDHI